MKFPKLVTLAAGVVLCLTACQSPQQIAKNQAAAQSWLDLQKGGAGVRISGTWFSEEWGKATFHQSGRHVTGTIDTYEVKGVVSGNKAYLTTWEGQKSYHAIILQPSGKNELKGTYTDGPAYRTEAKEQLPLEFRRAY